MTAGHFAGIIFNEIRKEWMVEMVIYVVSYIELITTIPIYHLDESIVIP